VYEIFVRGQICPDKGCLDILAPSGVRDLSPDNNRPVFPCSQLFLSSVSGDDYCEASVASSSAAPKQKVITWNAHKLSVLVAYASKHKVHQRAKERQQEDRHNIREMEPNSVELNGQIDFLEFAPLSGESLSRKFNRFQKEVQNIQSPKKE
jgi:hypothetical protein